MSMTGIRSIAFGGALLMLAGCGQGTNAGFAVLSPDSPARSSSSAGGTVTEQLSGSAIAGVVPEGQAQADESQFVGGGSTVLTVRVKNVNLPDGTALAVSLDFSPVGTLTISRGEGSLVADLGHFAVSNDQVRVNNGGTTILIGAYFK